jgi:HAE1 family hydrophobic/amphiphilic exporter-1
MKIFHRNLRFFNLILVLTCFGVSGVLAQDIRTNLQIAKSTVENQEEVSQVEEKDISKNNSEKINDKSSVSNPPKYNNTTNLTRVGVQTTDTLTISLDDAIRRALQNNNEIEVARDDIRFQETQLRALRGFYDPVLNFTPTYTRNSSTGNNATNDFRVNSNITQNIGPGGGFYQGFFNNTRTENSFTQAQLTSGSSGISTATGSAFYSTNTGVQFTQPLIRNFGIDNTRRQIKIQKKRLQQSDADFRRQTIEIIAQVQRVYWDLVFALRDQQNRLANLNLAKENLRQIEAKIEAGTEAPLARAEVNTEVANRESDLLTATQQVSVAENTLKNLFLKEATAPEWTASLVPTDKPVYSDDPVILDDAMKDAMANRPELRRLNLQKEINDIDIKYFKNQVKPQIDLVTSFSLNGISRGITGDNVDVLVPQFTGNAEILRQNLNTLLPVGSQIPNPNILIPATPGYLVGGFNQSLVNIFRSDAPNYSVGVTIQFPLRNRTAEANLAGARITEEQISAQTRSQEQTVIAEVRNAVQAVETSRQRVLTSRRARENAEIQLDGERKLFEAGRSTTFLLFQRENTLTNARNAEIRAETDYNKAISDLQRATSTTFRVYNIQIDSPVDDN